jgi:hypothetical protein
MKRVTLLLVLFLAVCHPTLGALKVSLVTDPEVGRASKHGLEEFRRALEVKGIQIEDAKEPSAATGDMVVVAGLSQGPGPAASLVLKFAWGVYTVPESLVIHKLNDGKKPLLLVGGSDDRGLMYALLDVADRVGWAKNPANPFSEVQDAKEKPDAPERGSSIYTMHKATFEQRFYDDNYWARYFDMLARDRYDSFVLIFGYENGGYMTPAYPWFFDVEGFTNIAVSNVTKEQQARNLGTLNHLIDMAHDRGLKVTIGLWDHIYRGGVQSGGMANVDPKVPGPDRVWGVNATNLLPYSCAALAKFLKSVPEMDDLQFRMHDESGLKPGDEQHAFWKAMFQVVKEQRPELSMSIRAKGLPDDILDEAVDMGLKTRVVTKYWMEQVGLPFHPTHVPAQDQLNRRHGYADLLRYPQRYKMHWRLWTTGTMRILLWGDPEYVRRFVETTHLYDGDGYDVAEPLATKMQSQPHDEKPFDLLNPPYRYYDYEFERYWYSFQLFGRLGYNPKTSAEVWDREFQRRFGSKGAPHMEKALSSASWILPRITATVFPYSKFPATVGWPEKQRWGDLPEYSRAEGSDTAQFQGLDEAARDMLDGTESAKLSPEENSGWFAHTSQDVLAEVKKAERAVSRGQRSKEFDSTMVDLKILAHLAGYHSQRILSGLNYSLFRRSHNVKALDETIAHERLAIREWEDIVHAAGDVYANNLMMGRRSMDLTGNWSDELAALKKGLAKVEQERRDFKTNGVNVVAIPNRNSSAHHEVPVVQHKAVLAARPGEPLRITAKVTAASGVKWVRLRYRAVNQYENYETLPMNQVGSSDEYEATVPGDKIASRWDFMYYFEVMDNAGNGKIYPDFEKETPYVVVKLER